MSKRSADSADLNGADSENMEEGERAGDSGAGGTESAGMGLVVSSVQRPISMGSFSIKIERSFMFTIVNSASSCVWFPAGGTQSTTVSIWPTDLFEFPFNHTCMWVPPRYKTLIEEVGSAWRLHSPEFWIDNMNYIAGQESTTADTKIDYSGNYAPTVDILINEAITPSARSRYQNYDAYGRQRSTTMNSYTQIGSYFEDAELRPKGLPIINFEAFQAQVQASTPVPPLYRHVVNHKMDSSISFKPPCMTKWRRNIPATDQPTPINAEVYNYNGMTADVSSANLTGKRPYWQTDANSFNALAGYLAQDGVNRGMGFRSCYDGKVISGPTNQSTYIRIRDPPKWGDGATAGSSSTSSVQQVALKANLNCRSSIILEVDMNAAHTRYASQGSNYYNNYTYVYPTTSTYTQNYLNTQAVVNPDCAAVQMSTFDADVLKNNNMLNQPRCETIYSDSE